MLNASWWARILLPPKVRSFRRFALSTRRHLRRVGIELFVLVLLAGVLVQTSALGRRTQARPLQATLTDSTNLPIYTNSETWGGGSPAEDCQSCSLAAATGNPGGRSVQPGQHIDPATGDFTSQLPLDSIPVTGGNLGLTMTYSSLLAQAQDQSGATDTWGNGWSGSLIPSISPSPGVKTVAEENGAQVTFTPLSGSTCPAGDASNSSHYTGATSSTQYCAPYRVDAQLSNEGTNGFAFFDQGQKHQIDFDQYGNFSQIIPSSASNEAEFTAPTIVYSLTSPNQNGCPTQTQGGVNVYVCQRLSDGLVSSYIELDSSGQVLGFLDPLGHQYTWTMGTITNPDDTAMSISNDAGADPSGTWNFGYASGSVSSPYKHDLTTITNPDNNTMTIGYDSVTGRADSQTDFTDGNTINYSYADSCGTCLASGQTQATTVTYAQGPSSDPAEIDVDSYKQGTLLLATFGSSNSTSPFYEQVSYVYTYPDATDQDAPIQESITHTGPAIGMQTTNVTTDSVGNVLTVENPQGHTTTNFYNDASNDLDELCWTAAPGITLPQQPSCTGSGVPTGAQAYAYDGYGQMTSSTDAMGNITNYGYYGTPLSAPPGKMCWEAQPGISVNNLSQFGLCYTGPGGADPSGTIPTGATAWTYDAAGNPTAQYQDWMVGDETIALKFYDADEELTGIAPPNACSAVTGDNLCSNPTPVDDTTYLYDRADRQSGTEFPVSSTVGGSTSNTFDAAGNLITTQASNGTSVDLVYNAYDADGRVCWTDKTSVSVSSTSCSSPPTGAGNSVTQYQYVTDLQAPTQVTNPDGKATTYVYSDPAYPSSATEVSDPQGKDIVYTSYDDLGRTCLTGPSPFPPADTPCTWTNTSGDTLTTYDILGNTYQVTDGNGDLTTYTYGNPQYPHVVMSVKDPLNRSTNFTYDGDGRQIQSQGPAGNDVTISYDQDGRKCFQTPTISSATCSSLPTGTGASVYAYNGLNELSSMTDNNGNTSAPLQVSSIYKYDPDGRLTSTTDDNGHIVSYAYSAGEYLTCIGYANVNGHNGDCSKARSSTNPIVKLDYVIQGATAVVSDTVDWQGNKITYAYSTDGMNDLQKVTYPTNTAESVTYGYDDNTLTSAAYHGPVVGTASETWTKNNDNLLASASELNSYSSNYAYDGQHNWIQTATNPGATGADTYQYFANGTLESDTLGSTTTSYSYDGASELTSKTSPTATFAYTNAGQRCWSSGSNISDPMCNSAPSGATSYAWNGFGQLCWTGVSTAQGCSNQPSSGVTSYTYDGLGLRTSETSTSGSTQDFTWATTGLIEDGTNAYIYGPEQSTAPAEQINLSSGAVSYLSSIPSGVHLAFDKTGSHVTEMAYSTYGIATDTTSSGGPTTPFGFEGGYTDPNGLVFLMNRYYDPTTCQFISKDPAVAQTGQPYDYAGDDPINRSDPNGLGPTQLQTDINAENWYATVAANLLSQAADLLLGAQWLRFSAAVNVAQGNYWNAFVDAVGASEWTTQAQDDIAQAKQDLQASRYAAAYVYRDQYEAAVNADPLKYDYPTGYAPSWNSCYTSYDNNGNCVPGHAATIGQFLTDASNFLAKLDECAYGASWGFAAGTLIEPGGGSVAGAVGGCGAGVYFGDSIPPNAPGPHG